MKKVISFLIILIVISILFTCEDTSIIENKETLNRNDSIIEEQEIQINELKKQNDDLLAKLDSTQLDLKYAKDKLCTINNLVMMHYYT